MPDLILACPLDYGVYRVHGYPGDGINALIGAFDRASGDVVRGCSERGVVVRRSLRQLLDPVAPGR